MKWFTFTRHAGLRLMFVLSLIMVLGQTYAEKKLVTRAKSSDLGGKVRYLAHVSTDKPIYRIGEKAYIRSVILNAADNTPLVGGGNAMFSVIGPKGEKVSSGYGNIQDSVSGFAWQVPDGQAGGEYKVKVSYPSLGIAPAVRKFDVRAYRAPRLKSQIVFFRDGYGPGDKVAATLEVSRAEGGIPENAKVTITARVDGKEVHKSTSIVDGKGNCTARFSLPESIERGEGTLAFAIKDGGAVETATKTIPILLQTVDLSIYPEGGDLIASVANRVYIEARTPSQKPADLTGIIIDSKGNQVGSFCTAHEGRGRFTFIPEKNESYSLKISEPSGIKKAFPLPAVKNEGVLIQATEDVFKKGEPVELRVISTVAGPLSVTLSKREVEVASLKIRGNKESGKEITADLSLTPPASADGVLVATVWNQDGHPLAERLIYREQAKEVNVEIIPDRTTYTPGGQVKLTVKATDGKGNPISAVVGLTVTDDTVLEMIEKREQAPRLPVMVLLEDNVKELADAHVYLDKKNPKASEALDLLLGTQGWRRFAFINTAKFLEKHGDAGRRVLAMRVVTVHPPRSAGVRRRGGWKFKKGVVFEGAMEVDVIAAGEVMPEEPAKPADHPAQDKKPVPAPVVREAQDELKEALKKALKDADRDDRFLEQELMADEERLHAKSSRAVYASVRLYAHQVRSGRKPGDRVDFTETLYWNAGVRTDKKTGLANVAFYLNDSVTSFRVISDAFDNDGALGTASSLIESVQPFYIEPKLPLEVTMGDRILLPISVVNGTTDRIDSALLKIMAAKGIDVAELKSFALSGNERARRLVQLSVGEIVGNTDFVLSAAAGSYADKVTRKLNIVPRGFPVEVARGGMLKANSSKEFIIEIPKSRVPKSVSSKIAVYPTPLASLTDALKRLMREPGGCFEQTSSTTYPLVMAQQYFMTHEGVDPKLIEKSKGMLDRGYKRLIGFECKKKGYEWFGGDPAHEALTAYGLLEFSDMAKVRNVDPKMLARTRAWLLNTRDGKGGFKRERRALHTWIADPDCSNGYITWALLESGEKPESFRKEIENVKASALKSKNSYVVALGANVALADGDKATAKKLMAILADKQAADGSVKGATTSIVGSGGSSLVIETTSLAMLAWIQDSERAGEVEKSIKWLADSCKAGRYGSTQSTVLALRAILAYDAARSKPKADGSIQLYVDGRKAGSAVKFDKETNGAIELTDIAELLEPGKHTVTIEMIDGAEMPFSLAVNYSNDKPDSSIECKVGLKVALADKAVAEGAVTEANVTLVNRTDESVPTPIAIIGIPGGLEVRHDQLKELVKAEKIAAYEVKGREVVLYWRSLKAGEKVSLPISMVAEIPGTYTAPASRAYLYYTDEYKDWVAPVKIDISAKK